MRIAGLFAGIGGFELGMHQAGHSTQILCDVLPASKAVLKSRFPEAEYHNDVTELKSLPSEVELLCAGFPCQDLSQAGRLAGLSGSRSGLIAEVFRLLSSQRIPNVVIENVPFMLQLNGGKAIRVIIDKLEEIGYSWAYRVVDSYGFGLAQRRERVFLLASLDRNPADVILADNMPIPRRQSDLGILPHGFYWTEGLGGLGWAVDSVPTLKNGSSIGIPSPPAVLLPDGRIIKLGICDGERLQGFQTDWTKPAEEVVRPSARWSLVGSAVSVPVARWIGQRLIRPGIFNSVFDSPFPSVGKVPRAARYDGKNRYSVQVSTDPLGLKPYPLMYFLREEEPKNLLSLKATLGFLMRTRRAKLRFQPGFIEAVEAHLRAMGGEVPRRKIAEGKADLLSA
jgi:DNA (cytosine-5)-methyltransferase 1